MGCLACVSWPLAAATTGQLSGQVLDQSGSPLPGVSISAASPAQIGGAQLAESDSSGRFHYPRLAPGDYVVQITHDGFLTQRITDVQVRLDRMTELQVTLAPSAFEEEIQVVERTPVVDPEQVSIGRTFPSEFLQEAALGMENRYLTGVLGQAAGVNRRGNVVEVMGGGRNNFVIDGIDNTDPVGNVSTFGFQIGSLSLDAVDEVAFHAAGFEAEYGRAEGGVVNLVTKSGGNSYSGSLDYRYADTEFQTSGRHFDPDEQLTETSDLNFSLGGPFIRDRLWFFVASESFDKAETPTGAATTARFENRNHLAKLTCQPHAGLSMAAKVMSSPSDWHDEGSSQFTAPEATYRHTWDAWAGHLTLNGVLSDHVLYGLRAGVQRSTWEYLPEDGDLTTIGHYNLVTGEDYGNGYYVQSHSDRYRDEIDTDLTWFLDDLAGQHEFKGGVGYSDVSYIHNFCYIGSGRLCAAGDETYWFLDDLDEQGDYAPYLFRVWEANDPQTFPGSIWSLYAQDAWRLRSHLTLKLGLRWDRSTLSNDLGRELADLSMAQPRIGVAWDIRGKGRDVLRASSGQFMEISSLGISRYAAERRTPIALWYSCSVAVPRLLRIAVTSPDECATVAAAFELSYRTDPEGWDPFGWVLPPSGVGSSEPMRISADLEPRYADELVLAYEREIHRRTSLELSYIKKDSRRLAEDTCNGNVPVPTAGSDCSYFVFYNLPGLRKSYEALMLRFESRAHDWMHLTGSYVYSDSRGMGPGVGPTAAFTLYPYHFVNQYGYLDGHSRHRVKLNGYLLLPFDLSLAINGRWDSEFRWTPSRTNVPGMNWGRMLLEPRGSRSESGEYQVDLQIGKGLTLDRAHVRFLGTVYNALDSENVRDVCRRADGCGAFELTEPIEWQQPRRYELGVRVEF